MIPKCLIMHAGGNTKKANPKLNRLSSSSVVFACTLILKRRLSTLPLLRSTIDVVGLNFSVRNGKRWIPNAITTLISFVLYVKTFDWTTAKSFFYVTSLISSLRP